MITKLIMLLATVFFLMDGFAIFPNLGNHYLGLGLACWALVEVINDRRKP